MSDVIKSIFTNYLVCAVIGGALEYLVPRKMKKTLRTAVVALMLFSSFSPLINTDFSADIIDSFDKNSNESTYDVLYRQANLTEKTIYTEIKKILINLNIDEYEIYIDTSVNEKENSIYLDGVRIEVDKEFQKKIIEIKDAIPQEYREITEVGVKK